MSQDQSNSVLRRKAAAGRVSVAAQRQITPCKALGQALVQAVDKRLDLVATTESCALRTGTLAELLDTLPEGGLLAVLDGPAEAQGLMVLDPAALSAVIEMTMTGRLAPRAPEPRRPTRTDAALTADLIDDMLRRFETPFEGSSHARWIAGFGYASFLDDPRPLGLMLEDVDYRILTLQADLDRGKRKAGIMLALPAQGRAALSAPPAAGGPARPAPDPDSGAEPAQSRPGPDAEDAPPPWEEAIAAGVMAGRVTLGSRLCRFSMPIAQLGALAPGVELPIPGEAIDEAEILSADGRCMARGRLGQCRGLRAIRLHGGAAAGTLADADDVAGQGLPDPPPAPGLSPPAGAPMPDLPDLPDLAPAEPEADPLAGLPMPDLPDLGGADDDAGDEPVGLGALPALPDLPPLGSG